MFVCDVCVAAETKAIAKAKGAKKALVKGSKASKSMKVRHSVHFHLPKTQTKARNPKARRLATKERLQPRLDKYAVIRFPLSTDSAMKKIEHHNTIVFAADVRANKRQIKLAVEQLYDVKVDNVNTLIRPDGSKKAFVRLAHNEDALDTASKLGIF